MFSYRNLLKQAWEITWKHKYLWFFGLFASLTAAGGSIEYQILTQNLSQNLVDGSYSQLGNIFVMGEAAKDFCIGLGALFSQNIWIILNVFTLLIISFTLLASFVWLSISSQAGLVDSVKRIMTSKKKAPVLSIQEGLTVGNRNFWPVLGLNVFIKIATGTVLFIISIPLLFMVLNDTVPLVAIYIALFILLLPVAVSFSLMIKYAIAFKVIEGKSFVSSLEMGWSLFMKNWLISLEMAVMLFIINFLGGIAALLIISFILFPLFLVGAMFNLSWLIILMLFLGLAVIILTGSLLTTFQTTTWTSLFLALRGRGGFAKLERIFRKK